MEKSISGELAEQAVSRNLLVEFLGTLLGFLSRQDCIDVDERDLIVVLVDPKGGLHEVPDGPDYVVVSNDFQLHERTLI